MLKSLCFFSVLFVAYIDHSGASLIGEPISTSNRHPLIQVYGLPLAKSANLTPQGQWRFGNVFEAGSIALVTLPERSLVFDGEFYQNTLDFRYGYSKQWELGVEVPFISHSGGNMDNFIVEWHNFFSLPNGDRLDLPTDDLRYFYRDNDEELLNVTENQSGIGDIRFNAAFLWWQSEHANEALRASFKLPTGSGNQLTGSGAADLSIGYHYSNALLNGVDRTWQMHTSAGMLYVGAGDVIPSRQRTWVLYGSTTLAWVDENIALKVQLDYHSSFYRSAFSDLDNISIQIVFGGTIELTKNNYLDITVAEDIQVRQSPDVVFLLAYRLANF